MQDRDDWYDAEKRIGDSVRELTAKLPPLPFSDIAGRIASGEPAESFEEFFAGDIQAHQAGSTGPRKINVKWIACLSAAALVIFIAGGAVLGAVFSSGLTDAKSSAEAADCAAYEEDRYSENGTKGVCEEACEERVSDSDLNDSDEPDSSGVSGS
ncbi:MAG: hypothetical protein IJM51_12015 [Clostridia bacterium]|nr:hypothetical protein [Clostridia bacterium]